MNLETIARTAFKATLEANSAYVAALQWDGQAAGVTKTTGTYVDPSIETPYVYIRRYAGGMSNDAIGSNSSQSMWVVSAIVLQDDGLALDLQTIINDTLEDKYPVIDPAASYGAWGPISLVSPVYEIESKLNFTYIRAGGIYTLRLADKKG